MFSGLVNLLFGSSEPDYIRKSIEPIDTDQSFSCSTTSHSLCTEAAEEDGWLLVNKEEEETESLASNDSQEIVRTRNPEWQNIRFHPPPTARISRNALQNSRMYDVRLSPPGNNPPPSSMEESWFITPPPCFTSTGPVYMKTSPYENLLIEHPSMSVYHSMTYVREIIRKCNATPPPTSEDEEENFEELPKPPVNQYVKQPQRSRKQRRQQRELRSVDFNNILNEIAGRRPSEKIHDKRNHQALCRSALKRANKVRDINGKGNRQRRSDLQHCRFHSGANNNRKC